MGSYQSHSLTDLEISYFLCFLGIPKINLVGTDLVGNLCVFLTKGGSRVYQIALNLEKGPGSLKSKIQTHVCKPMRTVSV